MTADPKTTKSEDDWRPIWTAPCTDTNAIVRYKDGREFFTDLDHDSDPEWWAERGATHWRYPTDAEYEAGYEGTSNAN